jgi:AcrR family transcriptional regulator
MMSAPMPRARSVPDAEILKAAARVIGRNGPLKLTLADVGREVGLAPATLLQRFGSKRGLRLALAAVLGRLRQAGFSVAMAAHAYALIDSFIYGFALQELSLPFGTTQELEAVAEQLLPQLPADAYPHLVEMMLDHALKPGYAFGNEFDFGLELILDGLDRLRDQVDRV